MVQGSEAYRGIVRYSHNDENLQFGVEGTNYRFKLDNNSESHYLIMVVLKQLYLVLKLNAGIGGSNVRYSVAVGHRALMSKIQQMLVRYWLSSISLTKSNRGDCNTGVGYQSI